MVNRPGLTPSFLISMYSVNEATREEPGRGVGGFGGGIQQFRESGPARHLPPERTLEIYPGADGELNAN